MLNLCPQFSMSFHEVQRNEPVPFPKRVVMLPDDDLFSMQPYHDCRQFLVFSWGPLYTLKSEANSLLLDTSCGIEMCKMTCESLRLCLFSTAHMLWDFSKTSLCAEWHFSCVQDSDALLDHENTWWANTLSTYQDK